MGRPCAPGANRLAVAETRVPYGRLSVVAKQVDHRERMREPAVRCPLCEAQTTVADLLGHVARRCPGRRAPHPLSRWVGWAEAIALGIAPGTMSRWVRRGVVLSRGGARSRQYLLRDLAVRLAERRERRRW
jgi:hypothetical protein